MNFIFTTQSFCSFLCLPLSLSSPNGRKTKPMFFLLKKKKKFSCSCGSDFHDDELKVPLVRFMFATFDLSN